MQTNAHTHTQTHMYTLQNSVCIPPPAPHHVMCNKKFECMRSESITDSISELSWPTLSNTLA